MRQRQIIKKKNPFFPLLPADQQIESRLHMKRKLTGFLDVQGHWFLKVHNTIDLMVQGLVKEKKNKIYTVSGDTIR